MRLEVENIGICNCGLIGCYLGNKKFKLFYKIFILITRFAICYLLCSIFIFFCFLSYFSPGKALLAGKGISRQVFSTPDGTASLLIHNGVKSFLKQHSYFHASVLSQNIFETLSTKIFVLGGLFMKQHTHAQKSRNMNRAKKFSNFLICGTHL